MSAKYLKKIVEAPARTLQKFVNGSAKTEAVFEKQTIVKKTKEYWKMLGPGLTTGAADDDPSGVATYSQVGAKYGFQLLWLSLYSFPLMAIIQEMCARIGIVTNHGLAANIKKHYPKWVLYMCTVLLFSANVFNIGADLGAMASVVQLLTPSVNFLVVIGVFAIFSLLLQIFTTYEQYSKYLKWLALILIAYVLSALSVSLPWREVLRFTIIPSFSFSKDSIILIAAVLGTTISPYLFFWQASQEVEEEKLEHRSHPAHIVSTTEQIKVMRIDVWSGMFFSNIVMFFIIAACAATLFAGGITDIQTAAQAADVLRPFAGEFAYFLFALGIIGVGLLGIPVLAGSASYALSESFGWREGLYKKLKEAYAFYGVIIIAVFIGFLLNVTNIDPIKALIYSAVLNALISPILLILIIQISSNKDIMGAHANKGSTTVIGWMTCGAISIVGLLTIVSIFY